MDIFMYGLLLVVCHHLLNVLAQTHSILEISSLLLLLFFFFFFFIFGVVLLYFVVPLLGGKIGV